MNITYLILSLILSIEQSKTNIQSFDRRKIITYECCHAVYLYEEIF